MPLSKKIVSEPKFLVHTTCRRHPSRYTPILMNIHNRTSFFTGNTKNLSKIFLFLKLLPSHFIYICSLWIPWACNIPCSFPNANKYIHFLMSIVCYMFTIQRALGMRGNFSKKKFSMCQASGRRKWNQRRETRRSFGSSPFSFNLVHFFLLRHYCMHGAKKKKTGKDDVFRHESFSSITIFNNGERWD